MSAFCALLFFCVGASVAEAALTVTGTSTVSTTKNVTVNITDLQLAGTSDDPIPVKLLVTSGTLTVTNTTGLTFTGGTSGSTLYFEGDLDDVNAGLASLTYTRSTAGSDTLELSLVEPGEVFFPENGHLYEYISSTLTWGAARTAAQNLTRYGATGYLTTITSAAENEFVADRLENAGWMGASDSASEGDWKWVTGPETGTSFWSGASGGSAVSGRYENWNTGEPNDSGANEDCGQFLSGSSGFWNDLPCSGTTLPGYVAEFGADGDMPEVVAGELTITTANGPTASTFSPLDDATNVSITTALTITFDMTVTAATGTITIKRVSDDATIQIISATSSSVTGSGTDTITIRPAQLAADTEFYVLISATAFIDAGGNAYAGISSDTAWSFRTEPSGGRSERYIAPHAPVLSVLTKDGAIVVDGTYTKDDIVTDEIGFSYWPENDEDDTETVRYTMAPSGFRHVLKDLVCDTEYVLRGYARNVVATTYTDELTFTTPDCTEEEKDDRDEEADETVAETDGRSALLERFRGLVVALMQRLGGIQQPSAPADTSISVTSAPATEVRNLTLGDEGDDVRQLQELLITANTGPSAAELARVGATGEFGTYTENALSEYQQVTGIQPPDGYFGPITRESMKVAGVAGLWW